MARLRAACSRQIGVGSDGLDQLIADPVQRIEAGERVLKNHPDPLAPDTAHLFRRQIVDPQARQIDLATGNAAGRIDQADHRKAGDGFSGAGFAHHAQHLALGDIEGNAVDGAQNAVAGDEFDPEVAHGKDRFGHAVRYTSSCGASHRSFGLSASRSQSPSRLMERISAASANPGKGNDPPLAGKQIIVADPDQGAERGHGVGHAGAQKRQGRLGDDRQREIDGRDHQDRPHRVRQHVPQHDHGGGKADQLRRRHVILVLLHHDRAAHRARILHPETQADRKHQHRQRAHGVQAVAEHRFGDAVDEQRDQDGGEGQLHVGDAHDQAVDGAAEIAGDQAEDDAERAGEQYAENADDKRNAQAVEDGRKYVAALLVGAEQERALAVGHPERRDPRIHQLKLRRIERVLHGEKRRQDREQEEQQRYGGRRHGEPGAAERIEHVAFERAPKPMTGGAPACDAFELALCGTAASDMRSLGIRPGGRWSSAGADRPPCREYPPRD